ncbi:hypothetical protein [Mameliella sp.]|uniref:COG3904 family protein n=1 Tax=Mameliella sp. TaxID=1924940 RepID=UPI003B5114BE
MSRFLSLLFFLFPMQLFAADFELVEGRDCGILLTGQIQPRDLDRFRDAYEQAYPEESQFTSGQTICLDSPGGSIAETLRLAEEIRNLGVGTVLRQDTSCLSACAVLFMFGTKTGLDGREFNRRMHYTATLGFHRPSLTVDETQTYSADAVSQGFDLSTDVLQRLTELGSQTHRNSPIPIISTDILVQMMIYEGQNFFYIDTVDKAGKWMIDVYGIRSRERYGMKEVLIACDNLWNWSSSGPYQPVIEPTFDEIRERVQKVYYDKREPYSTYTDEQLRNPAWTHNVQYLVHARAQTKIQGFETDRFCRIDDSNVSACGYDSPYETNLLRRALPNSICHSGIDADVGFDDYQLISLAPSNFLLKDLQDYFDGFEKETLEDVQKFALDIVGHCSPSTGFGAIVKSTTTDVSVKASPDPISEDVGKLITLEWVEIASETPKFSGPADAVARCKSICESYEVVWGDDSVTNWAPLNPTQKALRQCLDDDIIWWQVKIKNGPKGWVSVRHFG